MTSWLFSWNVARLVLGRREGGREAGGAEPSFARILFPVDNPGPAVTLQQPDPHPWRIHPAGTRAIPEAQVAPASQLPYPKVSWSKGLQQGLDINLCCCSKSHFSLLPARQGGETAEPAFPVAALLTPITSG